MNIFHRIALQGLKKNRTRTAVTIIGVILSTVMITGVLTFGVSLLDYMVRGAVQKYGDWSAAFLDADTAFVQERTHDAEVSSAAAFENIGYAELDGGQNPDKPYFFIAGFSQETFDLLPVTLLSGRLPENDREVLVSARAAVDGGVSCEPGDTIFLSAGNRMSGDRELTQADPCTPGEETIVFREEKAYTVVGTCRTPVFETEESPGYTLITRSDGTEKSDTVSLFLTLKDPGRVYSYVDKVKNGHVCMLNYDVLRIMGISDRPADRVLMAFLYSFGGIVVAIIMIGSVFLIYNSFSISLNERIREIGVLESVGATAKQLRNSVLFEGLCIGAAGIPIGVLVGLGGIDLILSVVSRSFSAVLYSGVSLDIKVSVPVIGGAAVFSLVTVLISAYLPAKKAVRMPVMDCIRQTNEIKVDSKAMEISQRKQILYGLEGTLALKNFKRNRKRYRSIVLSLVLSVVLFVTTNAVIHSLQQTADGFKIVSDFDIGFGAQDMEDAELLRLYDKLKNVEGVQESSCRVGILYSATVGTEELTDAYWETAGGRSSDSNRDLPVEVLFLDDDFYQKKVQECGMSAEAYTGDNGKFIAVAKVNDDSDEVEGPEDLADVFKSTSVDLVLTPRTSEGQSQEVSVTVVEIVPPDNPLSAGDYEPEEQSCTVEILAPWSAKEWLAPSGLPADVIAKGLCFRSETPTQSEDEMRKIIIGEETGTSYILLNCAEAYEQFQNYIFVANIFAYTFIALISLIAAANVFNTISTNIRLRRRELAMLRSVGMSDRDFNKMMRFECAFYGMKALLIGIPLSLATSVVCMKIMVADDVKMVLPWSSVGISAISVFFVIFITMMYAVSKIKKENIIDALRDEMT